MYWNGYLPCIYTRTFFYLKKWDFCRRKTRKAMKEQELKIQKFEDADTLHRAMMMSEVNLTDIYMAKKCAAQFLGICYRTIERWQRQGYIDGIRIGGRVYYLKSELLRVSRLYSSGIGTLSDSSRLQSLPELFSHYDNSLNLR